MAKKDYPFPEDEFDTAGAARMPEGVHRTPPSRWRVLLPFVIVLLVAPGLAYLGVSYLAGQSAVEEGGNGATSSVAADSSEGGASGPLGAAAIVEPVEVTAAPTPPVSREVAVVALNGTGTSGLAAGAAARLQGDGFTAVSTGNARSRVPAVSTVYYNNPDLARSAQQAADVLGVGPVVENAAATRSIAVVLRRDYQP